MSSFRKFTAALSALAVSMTSVFTFSVAVAATTFTDASNIASWALNSVTSLADDGVLSGRPDGSFDPKGQLNRAEVAKIAVLGGGLTEDTTGAPHFNDVAAADWFYSFVETLYNNGVVGGINGGALDSNGLATYNPGGTLNRAEGSKILVDTFDLETAYAGTPPNFPDVASSAWFYDYVETAYAHGIINGYDNGNFGPGDPITREQIAVIAQASRVESTDGSKRRSDYTAGAASSVEPDDDDPVIVASDGTLTVKKSSQSPADQTFPRGTSSTAVAAYDFTATGDDIMITGLVIDRTGVGEESDWTLYLYDGNERLTSGKTINSTTQQSTFTSLNIDVAAGTTKTITLKGDTSATTTSGGDSYFEIASADAVTSNAKSVAGSFAVRSNKNEINTSVTAGSIRVEKTGSITNPEVGADNVTIAKFKLTASTEAALVEQLAFLVDGSITAADVQNAKLYQSDTMLASASAVNSQDLLTFDFSTPYEIAKGDSRTFEIKADLNTGRSTDTVKIYVDETTDIVATGGTYGFGMSVDIGATSGTYDGTTCTSSAGNCSFSTLQGGDVTISSSGPTATDIAINGDDIVLMDFTVTSVSEVTLKKFGISITPTETTAPAGGLLNNTTDNVTDIKIVNKDTGTTLMGPIDATNLLTSLATSGTAITEAAGDNAIAYYVFQDEFDMSAGEELNLALTVDIENNTSLDGDTLIGKVEINTSFPEFKDVNNKTVDNAASIVPSTTITGKTMTIRSPSLTVTKSSTPDSDTFVKGTDDVCFVGLSLQAGDASDVKVTELTVTGAIDSDSDNDYNDNDGDDTCDANACDSTSNVYLKDIVGSVTLREGSTLIGSSESVQTDGTATFDNLSYVIDAGQTVQLLVCGDLSSSVSDTPEVKFGVAASGVTAEDEDGNSIASVPSAAVNTATDADETAMTVSQGGTLTISIDADTPKEDIVVAGTSDVAIDDIKFAATDEDFVITKLSINNRQSGVAAANLGDYDDNVTEIQLTYTNSDGATETKDGYLTNGTANFSGLDIFVEKDDDAVVDVTASLNTISAGADAGDFVDLNIAFNDFEAVAQGSGETYTVSKIDAGSAQLSFGTISYTATGVNTAASAQAVTLGSAVALSVIDQNVSLPVGTIITADSIIIVLTSTYNDDDTTMTGVVADDDDGTVALSSAVSYALPGTGYLTASNQMVVYETKPTVALASSSPSGSRTASASDGVMVFTMSADAQEKVQIRQESNALRYANDATTGWTVSGLAGVGTSSSVVAEGSNSVTLTEDGTSAVTDYGYYDTGASSVGLQNYGAVSFWIRSTAAKSAGDLQFVADDATDMTAGNDEVLNVTALTANTWSLQTLSCSGGACGDASTRYFGINIEANPDNSNVIYLDGIRFHAATDANDRIAVDFSSDESLLTTASNVRVLLKQDGTTVAEGGLSISSTSAATVTFFPYGPTYTDIDISKGTSKTFTVQADTTSIIDGQSGVDDLLTPSIDLGTSTGGTVTAGDIRWYDTNAQVTWLGQVINTTLNGNTLKY